jgi:PTS system mannose-specific IID component
VTSGLLRAFFRLWAVQGSWNYERMTGVGLGFAAEPLLEDLKSADPTRHAEAAVRSAEYFNSHPYLAGVALGALVRAEYDQVPGAQIARLRSALTSPLGALGDQFFWAGLAPATIAAAIVGVVAGKGVWALLVALLLYNAVRIGTGIWALRTGLASGTRVGATLGKSWLPRTVPLVGYLAAALVGVALPLAVDWFLDRQSPNGHLLLIGTIPVVLVAVWILGPRVTSARFGLAAIGFAALIAWGLS